MKKFFLLLSLLSVLQLVNAQSDSTKAPYLRFPNFPPVKLLLPDSASYFTKNDLPKKSAVMMILFNPQCEHCQQETEAITKNIDKFKGIKIIMATFMPFDSMMAFREKYKLAEYDNIIVAQDKSYFLPTFYMIHNLPFHAFYNKKKELISVFEGSMKIETALKQFD